MKWPLMTEQELHEFGIDIVLAHVEKEGVTVRAVNTDITKTPQIGGERWGGKAFIYVRTACYPHKGTLDSDEAMHAIEWANENGAMAFFASVGIKCALYPDKTEVINPGDMGLPIRHGSFQVNYTGLLVMTPSDRVKTLDEFKELLEKAHSGNDPLNNK